MVDTDIKECCSPMTILIFDRRIIKFSTETNSLVFYHYVNPNLDLTSHESAVSDLKNSLEKKYELKINIVQCSFPVVHQFQDSTCQVEETVIQCVCSIRSFLLSIQYQNVNTTGTTTDQIEFVKDIYKKRTDIFSKILETRINEKIRIKNNRIIN
eukprot:TRINITY_DN8251_c0_g1_i1.p1 TRINITY_DN8251_c0_g1~~TRINITY_DN8251_c0_g1_i1.p1  ORF type:complete len:155 (-),score=4.59 TRINITY_DN8251_c0_g1_i1:118-582(-)